MRCDHQWVKGHQDRKLPFYEISNEGRLNMKVDVLATIAYKYSGMSRFNFSAAVFEEEVHGVIIGGSKVTSKLKQRVLDQCGDNALRWYLTNKHGLSQGKLDRIN